MNRTGIPYANYTWNPVTGCTKVSLGCKHCYAERMATRLAGRAGYPADEPFRVTLHPERLDEPSRLRRPSSIFVCSMSDLFHPDVPEEMHVAVWTTMFSCPQHTFLILTKRPAPMRAFLLEWYNPSAVGTRYHRDGYRHVWLGVTAENQQEADHRIPILLQTPAAVRWVSYEPALGLVEFSPWLKCAFYAGPEIEWRKGTIVPSPDYPRPRAARIRPRIDWVICGAESGPGARPMDPDWARSVRDDCQAAGVAFYLKQMVVGGKLVSVPELDGRRWQEKPRRGERDG